MIALAMLGAYTAPTPTAALTASAPVDDRVLGPADAPAFDANIGRTYRAVLTFEKRFKQIVVCESERPCAQGAAAPIYTIDFGRVACWSTTDPDAPATWTRGDRITVTGTIAVVDFDSMTLARCTFTK